MKTEKLKNIPWKKIGVIASIAGAGISAVVSAIGENKKAEEFEKLKKDVASLKGEGS